MVVNKNTIRLKTLLRDVNKAKRRNYTSQSLNNEMNLLDPNGVFSL